MIALQNFHRHHLIFHLEKYYLLRLLNLWMNNSYNSNNIVIVFIHRYPTFQFFQSDPYHRLRHCRMNMRACLPRRCATKQLCFQMIAPESRQWGDNQ
jgi:hypothetical protein